MAALREPAVARQIDRLRRASLLVVYPPLYISRQLRRLFIIRHKSNGPVVLRERPAGVTRLS